MILRVLATLLLAAACAMADDAVEDAQVLVFEATAEEAFLRRVRALPRNDLPGAIELARFAIDVGLRDEAARLLTILDARPIDPAGETPAHREARATAVELLRSLGYQLVDGEWLSASAREELRTAASAEQRAKRARDAVERAEAAVESAKAGVGRARGSLQRAKRATELATARRGDVSAGLKSAQRARDAKDQELRRLAEKSCQERPCKRCDDDCTTSCGCKAGAKRSRLLKEVQQADHDIAFAQEKLQAADGEIAAREREEHMARKALGRAESGEWQARAALEERKEYLARAEATIDAALKAAGR